MTDVVLRPMRAEDVPGVVDVQEPASVAGLSGVFPQHVHPFPRRAVEDRWYAEIQDPLVDCFVIERDLAIVGFAAVSGDEVKHFGVGLDEWGTGTAAEAHDELIALMRRRGVVRPWLRVYTANPRGRRFWEKQDWVDTGERSRGPLPPHAELMTYALEARPGQSPGSPASAGERPVRSR